MWVQAVAKVFYAKALNEGLLFASLSHYLNDPVLGLREDKNPVLTEKISPGTGCEGTLTSVIKLFRFERANEGTRTPEWRNHNPLP